MFVRCFVSLAMVWRTRTWVRIFSIMPSSGLGLSLRDVKEVAEYTQGEHLLGSMVIWDFPSLEFLKKCALYYIESKACLILYYHTGQEYMHSLNNIANISLKNWTKLEHF